MPSLKVILGKQGVIQGRVILDSATRAPKCHLFGRVPYALPPTGHRRWLKPHALPADFVYGSAAAPGVFTEVCLACPQIVPPMSSGELPSDEDCLRCNIYVPTEEPPKNGWPVLVYLHGGFLQYGSPSLEDPSTLLHKTNVRCIFVVPGYRVGVLGFLASSEICTQPGSHAANFGFWDQRMAIEWTAGNIAAFGGNPRNITVGGLSAGAYSTFHQLAYDLKQDRNRQLIRRVIQWSNGCGVQPKTVTETQSQFDSLLSVLGIPSSLPAAEKLSQLRALPVASVIAASLEVPQKFFRPITDNDFISSDLFEQIQNGSFSATMRDVGVSILIGDLTQEANVYRLFFPPTSHASLLDRLCWDFPARTVRAICAPYAHDVRDAKQWMELFGTLYSNIQVYATERGLVSCISKHVPLERILRYRIDWRAYFEGDTLPKEFGVTHGTDLAIWFAGNRSVTGLSEAQMEVVRRWVAPLEGFLEGKSAVEVGWGTKDVREVRMLKADGTVVIEQDGKWDEGIKFWNEIEISH